jgi:hypothetical protein
MIAAIYARKSTDQSGISDEQRSVARQVRDAFDDIERALGPLTEAAGGLPEDVDGLMVRDQLLKREREWREARFTQKAPFLR